MLLNTPRPSEDMHVHSLFSDGKHSICENLDQADRIGLRRMVCVDHVRIDSSYVAEFVSAVRKERASRSFEVYAGVEAKILDGTGRLDIPCDLSGVDFIYAADHQFPLHDKCHKPREIRQQILAGHLTASDAIASLLTATICVLGRYPQVVLAHLFSVIPKIGLKEEDIPLDWIAELAWTAKCTGAAIEIDERWRCPLPQTVEIFAKAGVPIFRSTDSHCKETIGVYSYVDEVWPVER